MLYFVVGTVAEAQPFAERSICVLVDEGERIASKLHCGIERRELHVHGTVDVYSSRYLGIDYAAEASHYRQNGVDSGNKLEEALHIHPRHVEAEAKVHVGRARCEIQCRQTDSSGIGRRRQFMQIYRAVVYEQLAAEIFHQQVAVDDIVGVEADAAIDIHRNKQRRDGVGRLVEESIKFFFESVAVVAAEALAALAPAHTVGISRSGKGGGRELVYVNSIALKLYVEFECASTACQRALYI